MGAAVLTVQSVFAKAETVFRSAVDFDIQPVPAEETSLASAVLDNRARAVILGTEAYDGPLYEALARTGGQAGAILARFGVGHDGVDKSLARQNRIVVTNTPGVLDQSVAEHAIFLMGSLARHISRVDARLRSGQFAPETGEELAGKTLGILGLGAIGRRVAAIAHFGFGMRVLAVDCRSTNALEEQEGKDLEAVKADLGLDLYTCELQPVLRQSDVLSIHLPATDLTRNFVNAARLILMKAGALLVNTARGAVVEENALFDALAEGRLAGAALDVFQNEPYQPLAADKDLRTLPNVLLTPHVASNTRASNDRMAQACLENIASFFAGRLDELNRVDA